MVLTVNVTVPEQPEPTQKPSVQTPTQPKIEHNRTIFPYVTINGQTLIAESWNCTRPAYGAIGRFSITMSREVLNEAGMNLYQLGIKAAMGGFSQIPVDIYVETVDGTYHLFGGELDTVEVSYDSDTVTIKGRDWAGLLADIQQPLIFQKTLGAGGSPGSFSSSGLPAPGGGVACPPAGKTAPTGAANVNPIPVYGETTINVNKATPSSIAYAVAIKNGFKPDVYTYEGEPYLGVVVADLQINAELPRSLWDQLQFFARLIGWTCYVTPDRELYFGPIPKLELVTVTWNELSNSIPVNDLEITYNPRQNTNFLVVVASYNTATAQYTQAHVGTGSRAFKNTVVQNIPGVTVINNTWIVGTSGAKGAESLASIFSNLGKPVYLFDEPGLTSAQALVTAFEKALDIAKRELITRFTMDGSGTVKPLQSIRIEGDLGDFSDQTYYANAVEHSFSMDEGWYTHIHGWTLSPWDNSDAFIQLVATSGESLVPKNVSKYNGSGV